MGQDMRGEAIAMESREQDDSCLEGFERPPLYANVMSASSFAIAITNANTPTPKPSLENVKHRVSQEYARSAGDLKFGDAGRQARTSQQVTTSSVPSSDVVYRDAHSSNNEPPPPPTTTNNVDIQRRCMPGYNISPSVEHPCSYRVYSSITFINLGTNL
ncbi:hypothetical protein CBL_07897 [Carabus blaptoides fortunei]